MVTTQGGTQSPALGLAHEIDHALANPIMRTLRGLIPVSGYDNLEEKRVIAGSETKIAKDLGEDKRVDHDGGTRRVDCPIKR